MAKGIERRSVNLGSLGALDIDAFVSTAQRLEASGWDGVWIGEVGWDPFAMLAVLASKTNSIKLGTSIATWARSVPTMAACAATVDAISGGRFRLGIGTMPRKWNENWHGIDTSRMVRRMREYVEAIRVAWSAHSGRKVDYDGEILKLSQFTWMASPLRERIPIYLAASGPQMVRLAGRVADGILIHPIHTMKTMSEVTLPALQQASKGAERPTEEFDVAQSLWCSISHDRKEALHWAKAQIAWYLSLPYTHWVFDLNGWEREKEAGIAALARGDIDEVINSLTDEIAESICVVGTPDEVGSRIDRYSGLVGQLRFMAVTRCPSEFTETSLAHMLEVFSPS